MRYTYEAIAYGLSTSKGFQILLHLCMILVLILFTIFSAIATAKVMVVSSLAWFKLGMSQMLVTHITTIPMSSGAG
jgi:hypothetical protein